MAAIELGAIYRVYNPNASQYFALNDPTDTKFAGYVDDITGLDSPPIRENAQVKSAGMGGHHGPFWSDRRPWTISGFVMPVMPVVARSASQQLMDSVLVQCLQADGILTWLPSDGNQKQIYFRYQQPFRTVKGQSNVNRTFQFGGVTADWRIIGTILRSITVHGPLSGSNTYGDPFSPSITATNIGDAPASPVIVITGPINTPYVYLGSDPTNFFQVDVSLGATQTLTIDLTKTYPTVVQSGVGDISGKVHTGTNWDISVMPGTSTFYLAESTTSHINTSATAFNLQWYDSWA